MATTSKMLSWKTWCHTERSVLEAATHLLVGDFTEILSTVPKGLSAKEENACLKKYSLCRLLKKKILLHLESGGQNTSFSVQLLKIDDGLIAFDDYRYIDINTVSRYVSPIQNIMLFTQITQVSFRMFIGFVRERFLRQQSLLFNSSIATYFASCPADNDVTWQ